MRTVQNAEDLAHDAGVRNRGFINIAHVHKVFPYEGDEIVAIDDFNLRVEEGEFLCIVGPSGCGKTTLLRILAGLDNTTSGTCEWNITTDGGPVRSMVFQNQGVFPWMKVVDNVAYGLTVRGVDKRARHETAMTFLDQLGLSRFANAYPSQLSGGMLQRVNVARAFANDPRVLLMDEPFANLDEQTKLILQDDLLRIWEGTQKTVVFITHSLDEAITLGDRVVVMSRRPGRLKTMVDVSIPRPRHALTLRQEPNFLEHRQRVWDSLSEEIVSLRDEEYGGAT